MNWDLALNLLFNSAKYCPLCGAELVLHEKTIGNIKRQKIVSTKSCPNGHGEMDVAGGDARGPRLEFDPPEDMWKDVAK